MNQHTHKSNKKLYLIVPLLIILMVEHIISVTITYTIFLKLFSSPFKFRKMFTTFVCYVVFKSIKILFIRNFIGVFYNYFFM